MKKETKKVEKAPKKVEKKDALKNEKMILAEVSKIKNLIVGLNKKSEKMKDLKVGVFIDILAFNSITKDAIDGCSLGLGASVADELHYIDSVKGSRMLRITDNFIDNVSRDIKRKRGLIK
jgi:hypothetical protein